MPKGQDHSKTSEREREAMLVTGKQTNMHAYNQLSENCRDSLDTFTHRTRLT